MGEGRKNAAAQPGGAAQPSGAARWSSFRRRGGDGGVAVQPLLPTLQPLQGLVICHWARVTLGLQVLLGGEVQPNWTTGYQ